jgi:hypothetical protein
VQAQETTYVWQSLDGGGNYDFSGTIVLDSSCSSAGTVADIVSFTETGPYIPYPFYSGAPATITITFPNAALDLNDFPFTWNSSQITSIYLSSEAEAYEGFTAVGDETRWGFSEELYFDPLNYGIGFQDTAGAWVAVVPEPSVPVLLAISFFALCAKKLIGVQHSA